MDTGELKTFDMKPEGRYLWSVEVAEAIRSATAVVTSNMLDCPMLREASRFLLAVYKSCSELVDTREHE